MNNLKLKYSLDEAPPWIELILLGLQWLAIAIPTLIIIGPVVAGLYFDQPGDQVVYVQKLFFISGLVMLIQVLWGHRLPLVAGPASVLLIGVLAAHGRSMEAVYSAILIGGALLSLLSITGLFSKLTKLFTPRVIAVILLLIAFTLSPTILNLILSSSGRQASVLFNLLFAVIFVFLLFAANKWLTGVWKSTLVIWAMIFGTLVYKLLFPVATLIPLRGDNFLAGFFKNLLFAPSLDPGLLFSFLVCFFALAINDLGSIQSVGEMLKLNDTPKRITRGIVLTGLANVLAGFMGVIGPVNFSLSPGVIASTGCASRFVLIPAALGLLVLSFMPWAIGLAESIPTIIIGTVMLYIMCSQMAAGLLMAFNDGRFDFESGLIIGLPLLLGVLVAFLPSQALDAIPVSLRPVIGNGFAVGVLTVMLLEHVVYRHGPGEQQLP